MSHYTKRALEKAHPLQSIEAWTTFTLQVVKVFLLNRVTPKSFRKDLPGLMPDALGDEDEAPPQCVEQPRPRSGSLLRSRSGSASLDGCADNAR